MLSSMGIMEYKHWRFRGTRLTIRREGPRLWFVWLMYQTYAGEKCIKDVATYAHWTKDLVNHMKDWARADIEQESKHD